MSDDEALAARFEENRTQLRAVAYRMLGSVPEAEDAVQEAWLRLHRVDASRLDNLAAWLTTVVARVCLDMLRSRTSRREESLEARVVEPVPAQESDPEGAAVLADSVGLALLVVLDTLTPNERLAFVLHDMFDVGYDEIAPIVGQSPAGARQLASRARRRVRQQPEPPQADPLRQREVVEAFLTAARGGDFDRLLTLLDPDVVLRGDAAAARMSGAAGETRGAAAVAGFFSGRAQGASPAVIDGTVGAVVFIDGQLRIAMRFTVVDGVVTALDAIADPEQLGALTVTVLPR